MTRPTILPTLFTLTLVALAVGCGPTVQLQLPERFVMLTDDANLARGRYEVRATTPDGVVVGVQSLEHRVDGSLAFWTEAITRRVRDQQGYALVSEEDVRSASGESGHLMRFARDLDGHGYKYSIALFVTPDRIYLVEAGGRTVAYDALESGIEEAINQMRL